MSKELPIESFASAALFEKWLQSYHATFDGVWIKMAKKDSGIASINHDQALDIALCFGWIDGQRKGLDEHYFLQKFTPRRKRSLWSKRNIEKVARLTTEARMRPSGQAEIDRARVDGRWAAAYDSPKMMEVPRDFLIELSRNEKAATFFKTLTKTQHYSIGWRLQTAKKSETRLKRLNAIILMLSNEEFS